MDSASDLKRQVMMAAQAYGVGTVLFRNAIGRTLGLTITDSECLSLLTIRGTSTPTELARHTGLTTGSTTAMLDRLEKRAFITRTPNPNDRRGVLVEVSAHYRSTVGPLVAGIQKANTDVLTTYSDAELLIITDFLNRFTWNMSDQTKHIETGQSE